MAIKHWTKSLSTPTKYTAGQVCIVAYQRRIGRRVLLLHKPCDDKTIAWEFFDLLNHRQKLLPVSATPYECGISVLVYTLYNE